MGFSLIFRCGECIWNLCFENTDRKWVEWASELIMFDVASGLDYDHIHSNNCVHPKIL